MKKMAGILSVLLMVFVSSGCCTLERTALDQVEKTHEIVLPKYLEYTEKDVSLGPDEKADRKKLVESLKRLVAELKKTTE